MVGPVPGTSRTTTGPTMALPVQLLPDPRPDGGTHCDDDLGAASRGRPQEILCQIPILLRDGHDEIPLVRWAAPVTVGYRGDGGRSTIFDRSWPICRLRTWASITTAHAP